ncbi:MAG: NADH-quinone oxidoreductase subunit M [Desulfobacteraceae bacterium]|nr:MAG: NADH-quinone oxidoreductase subunit M [Desulfobacteraceae bacterium]
MILAWLIAIPVTGGMLAWLAGRRYPGAARWAALATLLLELACGLSLIIPAAGRLDPIAGPFLADLRAPWIPSFGIQFHLAADGLSLVLIALTLVLGLVAVVCSWNEISHRQGFFFFNLLWVIAGIIGVFTALDLFLFYFFWELMMVPMFFLIAMWGHENRIYAAIKFFLFTQASGLLMLAAIVGLYVVHGRATGTYTFDYPQLIGTAVAPGTAMWLMLGFLVAFAVKLPAFPVHSWLPDAHTEAPTAGSIILAGLLLKTGAYGMLRFVVPLFPDAAGAFAPAGMVLGVIAILYGALLAFSQTDLKRLVAYTSISHMGFVMLAVFAWNELALQGAVLQMICHGISTGALFAIVGMLQERLHTRDLRRMGGLWDSMPRMGGMTLVFALAALGLPGLGNFVGEFLILFGVYPVSPALTIIAALGLVSASIYALWIMQKAFHGNRPKERPAHDLNGRESATLAFLAIILLWLGLYPQPVLQTTRTAALHLLLNPISTPIERPAGAPYIPSVKGKPVMAAASQGDRDASH